MPTSEVPLMLIPAAGYGRRVGSPPAKELMLGAGGKPMILTVLECAARRDWPVLVITRSDKVELIQFLKHLDPCDYSLKIQTVSPTRDWPDTLLQSESFWRSKNIVVLPDTEWAPESALDDLNRSLDEYDVAFASHEVESQGNWGVLTVENEKTLAICEKPRNSDGNLAWGLYGFRASAGRQLLKAQSESTQDHGWRQLPLAATEVGLSHFRDLARP